MSTVSSPSTAVVSGAVPGPRPNGNRLLMSLPADVQQRIYAVATRVPLDKFAVLVEAGAPQPHLYFPCSGLLSLQTMTQDGNSVEVAMVGREGVATLPCIGVATAAYATVVAVPGGALCVRADALQAECERTPILQRALMQHWHRDDERDRNRLGVPSVPLRPSAPGKVAPDGERKNPVVAD